MKKILMSTLVVPAMMISCQADNNSGLPVDDLPKRELVMEIFSHSQSVVQTDFPDKLKHAGFLTDVLLSKINGNPLAQRMLSQQTEENDTVFDPQELPVFSEMNSVTRIFADGTSSAEILDLTPDDANPAELFKETPVQENQKIFKAVIENQQLRAYNKAGNLLVHEDFPLENLSQFIDTVKFYVEQMKSSGATKSIKKMNPLLLSGKNQNGVFLSRILPNGHVVIESNESNPQFVPGLSTTETAAEYKTVSELDPQMSKILKFELFNGKQLISRKTFRYNENPQMRNSVFLKDFYGENPVQIDTEMLITGRQGLPMIRTSRELFIRNQTNFYF